jgi:methylase of polypeptide subunit release factors
VDTPPAASITIVDIGCGSGAGGLFVADLLGERVAADVILADINPKALRYARVSASLNGVPNVRTVLSDVFDEIDPDVVGEELDSAPYDRVPQNSPQADWGSTAADRRVASLQGSPFAFSLCVA